MMRKNVFLTFCCACVPGFGQMYQGYMKRGVSLATWFWGTIMLASFLGLGVLTFLLPVIWAYSFFDTFNIRNLSPEQRAVFPDTYLPGAGWLQKRGFSSAALDGRRGKIAAWVLMAIGAYLLYANFVRPVLWRLSFQNHPFISDMIYKVPTILVACAVIGLGLWMLGKNKNKNTTPTNNIDDRSDADDTTPFKGE